MGSYMTIYKIIRPSEKIEKIEIDFSLRSFRLLNESHAQLISKRNSICAFKQDVYYYSNTNKNKYKRSR